MIASIVWDVDPILFKVGSWEVRWYGLMWGLGFILAYEMVSRLFKKEKYPEEWVDKVRGGRHGDPASATLQGAGKCDCPPLCRLHYGRDL